MQEVAIEGVIFFWIMLTGLGLSFVFGVLLIILHNILYRKFDRILFIRPYFTQTELALYAAWPIGLLRSIMYMTLILFPDHARKKRFKELSLPISVSRPLKIACAFCMLLLFLTALLGVAFFLYGGALYVINNA
ncbi:MAG: hypothetical protein DRR42_24035 [Gammaproteobacteria bacterium]|nr:MAG: hypothetical protein DRR42_24035 [Gammaproteobacteria bacterium]